MAKAVPGMAPPAGSLDAKLMSWGAGEIMHRVHDAVYPVDSFNPSPLGNARFSPIRDSARECDPHALCGHHPARRADGDRLS